jgi:hypothetical protein
MVQHGLRADFHLHTKVDKEFVYSSAENNFVNDYVNKLIEQKVQIGIITNHNKIEKRKTTEKLDALGQDYFIILAYVNTKEQHLQDLGDRENMNTIELLDIISAGETSNAQFKRELDKRDKIAADIIAFFHSKGGMYEGMNFFNANLNHRQAGQNFNTTGKLEISELALEEYRGLPNSNNMKYFPQESPQ